MPRASTAGSQTEEVGEVQSVCGVARASVVGLVAGAWVAIIGVAPAEAHNTRCAHTHDEIFPDDIQYCDNAGADCGDSKECIQRQNRNAGWCSCEKPLSGISFDGHSGLVANAPGLPVAGASIVYTSVDDPLNVWDVLELPPGLPALETGPGGHVVQSVFTLDYGGFVDPTAIPVTLVDFTLTMPDMSIAGTSTGPNVLHLSPGQTVPMLYDSVTGVVDTQDSLGIPVVIDNDQGTWPDSLLHVQVQIDPAGATLVAQGGAYMPLDVPAASAEGLLVLASLMLAGAGAALLVQRRRYGSPTA